MNLARFKASLNSATPPPNLPPLVEALWWEARGNWMKAHEIAQQHEDANSCWVHAYLHRVEGDLSNAGYWYRRAQRSPANGPLNDEWEAIAAALL